MHDQAGLFYQHRAKLPDDVDQRDTDRAIASLANVLRVRRKALGFVEARRGSVYGRLVIRDGSEVVDLARAGPGGRTIPRFTDDAEIVSSDAARIVIVEKEDCSKLDARRARRSQVASVSLGGRVGAVCDLIASRIVSEKKTR